MNRYEMERYQFKFLTLSKSLGNIIIDKTKWHSPETLKSMMLFKSSVSQLSLKKKLLFFREM